MNDHNNSLGKRSTNAVSLNNTDDNNFEYLSKRKALSSCDHIRHIHGGPLAMADTLREIQKWILEQRRLGRKPKNGFNVVLNKWVEEYERQLKASVGMPTSSDSVTTQFEAPRDIPTMPIEGYQLLKRKCYFTKKADQGTTAGGFYAEFTTSDLANFIDGTVKFFRVSKVSSWTAYKADGTGNSGFAGVYVASAKGSAESDSITPIWSENWTPIGEGYAGITTVYPAGDFPFYTTATNVLVLTHFTAIGGTGGITGVPVVFHVDIEYLI